MTYFLWFTTVEVLPKSGGCFGVGELLGAAHHLIALLQLLVDSDCQIQAPMIPVIVRWTCEATAWESVVQ